MWSSRSVVAVILAIAVLIFVVSGTALRDWFGVATPVNPDVAAHWKDIVNVLIGALAGYIAGKDEKE